MRRSAWNPKLSTLSLGLVLVVALGVVPAALAESVTEQEMPAAVPLLDLQETEPAQSTDSASSNVLETLLPAPTALSTCPLPPPPPPPSCICGGCCECNRCWRSSGTLAKCLIR